MRGEAKRKLPAAVVGLGLVSLFTDASSEAIFPLLPAFLTSLGATNVFIGFVEGAADFVSSVLKYVTGILADRRTRMKPLVVVGYGISTVARPLVAFAFSPWHVLLVRVTDRIGKGVRTSPRDALIAQSTEPSMRAQAYGLHRAMDHAGAALGTLLAAGILWSVGATGASPNPGHMRTVFLWAAFPGILAMVVLVFVREPVAPISASSPSTRALPVPLKRALWPITLFAFANATDAFILVKAARMGAAPIMGPAIWLGLHIIKASSATFGGRLADERGKRNALALGWSVYAVTWGLVGFADDLPLLVFLASAYGVSHGLVEGAEKALVAELAGGSGKGKAFGAYNMLIGLTALVSSATFGLVWDKLGDRAAFVGSGAFALVAAGVLVALVKK